MPQNCPYHWLLIFFFVLLLIPSSLAADFSGVQAGTGCGPVGTIVSIPVFLEGIQDPIGNMDLTIAYDSTLVKAIDVLRGDLTSGALFDYNLEPEAVRIGIASKEGIQGTGTLAYLLFQITGTAGSSPVEIEEITANHAKTLNPLELPSQDGSIQILSGIRFVMEGGVQKVIVDPQEIGEGIRIDGDRILCDQCGLTFTIATGGLSDSGRGLEGVVQAVTLASERVFADLSFGRVEGRFEFTLPKYPTDGYFSLSFTEDVDPATRQALEGAAAKKGLAISTIPFLAQITHGYGKTGPATGHFTIPNTLVESLGGMESLWFGHQSDYVSPEFLKAEYESGPDQEGMITLNVYSPDGLSIFAMASAKVKSIANPPEPGATPSTPQTGLTLFVNMIVSATTLSTGNLLVGAVVIGLCIFAAAIGIFYYVRKRSG
jgi:hypothetical protein